MKKILVVLLGLLLFSVSCKEEDSQVKKPSIVGTWMPVKVVETVVNDGQVLGESNAYYYDDCQLESRYVFNDDLSGHITTKDNYGGTSCLLVKDENFTYSYNDNTGAVTLQYITFKDEGKISDVTEDTMNLQIETTEGSVYTSKTYTLKKVN